MGLIDSTLREGEQMMGVYFTLGQKLEIVRHLAAIGIEEIELGIAAMSPEMSTLILQARQLAPDARLALWCRGLLADIQGSAALNPDVLSISLPVSDLHITRRLGKDRAWVLQQIPLVIDAARQHGVPFVSLGLEDASRADTRFLATVLRQAEAAGADRVRLSDTVGVADPLSWAERIRLVKQDVSLQVGVHTHNDFGMATANALSAVHAGADWADVTVLGLGERAGNARLEEVVGYLALHHHCTQYKTKRLVAVCRAVARMTGLTISPYHPIIGKRIFACESGIHLDGLAKHSETYEPYPPECVLAVRRYALGKKAGSSAVYALLRANGVTISRDDARLLVPQVRAVAHRLGRPLSDREVVRLATIAYPKTTPACVEPTGGERSFR